MVDPTKNIGSILNIQQNRPSQNEREGTKRLPDSSEKPVVAETDSVSLSQAALDLAQAQSAAAETRAILQSNHDLSLGLDPSFVEENA